MLTVFTENKVTYYVALRAPLRACRGFEDYLRSFDVRTLVRVNAGDWIVGVHEHDLDQAIAIADATLQFMIEQQSERNEEYA